MHLTRDQQLLVERHLSIAKAIAFRSKTWLTKEDALSASYFGLCKAVAAWNPDHPAHKKLENFIIFCCDREIKYDSIRLTVRVGKRKRKPLPDIWYTVDVQEKISIKPFLSHVEKKDRMLIDMYLSGIKQKQIAVRLGISWPSVRKRIERSIKRIKANI